MKTKQVREHKKERPRKEESKAKQKKREKKRKEKRKKERKKETQGSRLLKFQVCRKCTYPRGKVDAGSEWVPG